MPSVILGATQADVLQGAQATLTQLFETYPGSGQAAPASGVTIAISATTSPGSGTGTPVAATSSGVSSVNGSMYSYTWNVAAGQAPGDYAVTFSGTGGANGSTVLTYSWVITVAAVSPGSPAPGGYATLAQYRARTQDTGTPDAMVLSALRAASDDIDLACIGAVYPVNQQGMPTDPLVIDVLSRACAEQARFLLADNDLAGVKRQYASTGVAGVTAVRAKNAQGLVLPPLAPRALSILHANGVLPNAPLVNW